RVLEDLAQAAEPFYYNLESIRLLHALNAPDTVRLIRRAAAKIPDTDNLKGQYLLRMAIAVHQLGDPDYALLLGAALRSAQPMVRMDAARFIAAWGELSDAALLVALLDDQTEWNHQTVSQVALEALQRLTLEHFGADSTTWQTWFDAHRATSR